MNIANAPVELNSVTIIKRFLDAWAAQDLETVLEIFAENAVYKGSQGDEPGTTYNGRKEIGPAVKTMFSAAGSTQLKVLEIYPFEGGATVTWHVDGNAANGAPVNVLGIDIFIVIDGHITVKDAYRKVKS